jgi:hypothetical protein
MKSSLLLASLFLISCAGIQKLPPVPSHRIPDSLARIHRPVGEWEIRGKGDLDSLIRNTGASVATTNGILVVDLKGAIIDGKKQDGDGGQGERQTPLFRARVPFILKNGFIKNNKNAATFYASNSGVKSMTWLNVGEDAVATADNAKNFVVQNCEFLNDKSGDKSIQLNEADGAEVHNNLVYGGITGVRVGKYDYVTKTDKANGGGNEFVGVDTAWNLGEMILDIQKQNGYKYVDLPFKTTNGGKVLNADGRVKAE